MLEALSALHAAGLIHGNLSDRAVRREDADGPLKLCEFTFSGGRATVVTEQPVAYQTRNIVNAAQPRVEDDIHAAGMLGYRILLGRGGEARVLTGRTDDDGHDRLVAAILGQVTDAPNAETLFPQGHKSGAQIARLLARMTGRLPNAAPFSSAGAAHKALRSVLANPQEGIAEDVAPLPPIPGPVHAMAAAPVRGGVSRGTAVALFTGFLASTAAATWFYLEHEARKDDIVALHARATAAVTEARDQGAALQAALDEANAQIATLNGDAAAAAEALSATSAARDDVLAQIAALQAELDAANTRITELSADASATAEALSATSADGMTCWPRSPR